MGNYDGPSFYKKGLADDQPQMRPFRGSTKDQRVPKYRLPASVRTREDLQNEAHEVMETPSSLNRRFRSTKLPNSLQHLDGWKQSRRNHGLIAEIKERLTIDASDYLLFGEFMKKVPKNVPKLELQLEPEPEPEAKKPALRLEPEAVSEKEEEPEPAAEPAQATDRAKAEPAKKAAAERPKARKPQVEKSAPAPEKTDKGVTLVRKDLVNLPFGQKKPSAKRASKKQPVKKPAKKPVKKQTAADSTAKKKTVHRKSGPARVKQEKAKKVQEQLAAEKNKPHSGLHRSLSTILADDKKAMEQWNSNLNSLFSSRK